MMCGALGGMGLMCLGWGPQIRVTHASSWSTQIDGLVGKHCSGERPSLAHRGSHGREER